MENEKADQKKVEKEVKVKAADGGTKTVESEKKAPEKKKEKAKKERAKKEKAKKEKAKKR